MIINSWRCDLPSSDPVIKSRLDAGEIALSCTELPMCSNRRCATWRMCTNLTCACFTDCEDELFGLVEYVLCLVIIIKAVGHDEFGAVISRPRTDLS